MNITKLLSSTAGLLTLVGALALSSCAGGPERVPHQPIKGVDTEQNQVDNPNDRGPAPGGVVSTEGDSTAVPSREQPATETTAISGGSASAPAGVFLDEFVRQVADAHRANPGVIAVFPALSHTTAHRELEVTGLGELLMQATADGLEAAGVQGVVAGDALKNDLTATNRGLDALLGLDDVYWIGDRLGAQYLIFGSADVRDLDSLNRDQSLEVRWQAIRSNDRSVVASWRPRLSEGALAQRLYRYHQTASDWRVGKNAPRFDPSLQLETKIQGRMLVRTLLAEHGKQLNGRHISVEPTVVAARSGARAKAAAWAGEFERKLTSAHRAGGDAIDETSALASGPVTIQGKEYSSFGDAMDAFRMLRNELATSGTGDLEHDIAEALTEQLRSAAPGLTIVANDAERDTILNLIRREVRAARQEESVDAETIASFKAKGADMLLSSTLRLDLENYVLRISLLDLTTGAKSSHSLPFEPRFKEMLDRACNR